MALTAKIGLEYFPFDVDFFQDIKIRKLIKYQGGKAVTVYALLLCTIYKNGYYAEWDKELPFIISEQSGYTEAYILEVIECCLNIGLLSRELFDSNKILTSRSIQERYRRICAGSRRICAIDRYNLLDIQPSIIPEKTETAPIPATPPRKAPNQTAYSGSIDDEINAMKQDSPWIENVSKRYAITPAALSDRLSEFALECDKRHSSMQDARSHFCRWLKKKIETSPAPSIPKNDYATRAKERAKEYERWEAEKADPADIIRAKGYDPQKVTLAQICNPEWRKNNPPEQSISKTT